jgi:multidrug efflux pump subunit AcrA (membrane-fusion protein)
MQSTATLNDVAARGLPAGRAVSRLDIRLPVRAGLFAVILFFGAGLGAAAYVPIDKGVGLPGTIVVESKTKPIQHPRSGSVESIHVIEGQKVRAGDVIVTLDTRAIDEQIGALKAQAEAAKKQLDLVKLEAATMADLLERKLAAKSRVLALERQVAEVEKESAGLAARISVAEQELERSVLRAPVAGRVLNLRITTTGAVLKEGDVVADIVPEDDRLVLEGRLSPNQIENVKPGMPAKVWLTALSWREQRPLAGKLAWVSADSVEDKRTGAPYFVARIELEDTRSEIEKRVSLQAGMRSEVLLMTGQRTLLDQLIDPVMRNVNRAFRS